MSRRRKPRTEPDELTGVLVIDKPRGPTSARVVDAVKKKLGVRRVGHTGTLDPMATGVLPVCIGMATKLATFLLADDKAYTGTITLGVSTDSHDADGTPCGGDAERAAQVTRPELDAALKTLRGDIDQVPPMHSALRKDGVRLYEHARAGREVEIEARRVRVDRFEAARFESPHVDFVVHCSKGTYVRSLARDLGQALGCGAHLSALRRVAAGGFTIEQAIELDSLTRKEAVAKLIRPPQALAHLPHMPVGADLVGRVTNGLNLRWEQLEQETEAPTSRFCVIGPAGELLAVAHMKDGLIHYDRVFKSQVSA